MKILFVILILVISSCVSNTKDEVKEILKPNLSHQKEKVLNVQKNAPIEVEKVSSYDISGEYVLLYGKTNFIGSETNKINKAAIIIERLSETDFGFYSASKIKKISPVEDFGVLRYFNDKFYNLGICDDDWVDGYSNGNYTTGIYLHNLVRIQIKEDILSVIRYGGNFKNYMIYKKINTKSSFNISLIKTLNSSKLKYEKFLKKYENAKKYDRDKLHIEFVFENNIWISNHNHKENYSNWSNRHSYQNPYQKGQFIKADSIFIDVWRKYAL